MTMNEILDMVRINKVADRQTSCERVVNFQSIIIRMIVFHLKHRWTYRYHRWACKNFKRLHFGDLI